MDAESYQLNRKDNSHMQKPQPKQAVRCANCDIEILWTPTVVRGKTFCSVGGGVGGPFSFFFSLYRWVNFWGVINYFPKKDPQKKKTGKNYFFSPHLDF